VRQENVDIYGSPAQGVAGSMHIYTSPRAARQEFVDIYVIRPLLDYLALVPRSGAVLTSEGAILASEGRDRDVIAIYADQVQESEMLSMFKLVKDRGH